MRKAAGSLPIHLMHVVTGLGIGGAEKSLYRLVSALGPEFVCEVVSLSNEGPIGEQIRALGVPVTPLNIRPGRFDTRLISRLRRQIRSFQPDIIQTWMYHADLIGGLAGWLFGPLPVIWNIRHTITSMREFKPLTRLIVRLNALCSHILPDRIVCNSHAGLRTHVALGYDAKKMMVIPNGFDLEIFTPNLTKRQTVREELGLKNDTLMIGMCGRFHQEKDHHTFIHAAALLLRQFPEVHFVLWGKGIDWDNVSLIRWLDEYKLRSSFHLLGERNDTPQLTAALDIASLSSISEAFPNVIGEAMACGVPCVVTDVGDAALLVGETGRVVPPRNPQALADGWKSLLALSQAERIALGQAARQRIEAHFGLSKMVAAYATLYRDIMGRCLPDAA